MNVEAVSTHASARPAIVLLWIAALAIVAYWAAFFTDGSVQASTDACYLVFERSFPLPDGFVALSAIIAAEGLRRHRPFGVLWALLTAGGFLFLGLIDIAYNIGNGMYVLRSGEMAIEAAINIACLGFAGWLSTFCWRRRGAFGA